jgi:hypothetical protein
MFSSRTTAQVSGVVPFITRLLAVFRGSLKLRLYPDMWLQMILLQFVAIIRLVQVLPAHIYENCLGAGGTKYGAKHVFCGENLKIF